MIEHTANVMMDIKEGLYVQIVEVASLSSNQSALSKHVHDDRICHMSFAHS